MLTAQPKRLDIKAVSWGFLAQIILVLLAFPLLFLFSALTKLPAEQVVKTTEFHVLGFLFGALITVGIGYIVAVKARRFPVFNAVVYGAVTLVISLPSYFIPRDAGVSPMHAVLEITQLLLFFPLIVLGAKWAVTRRKFIN